MKYAIDTEFIDTPTCSALISFAIVNELGESRYFEFEYPEHEITHWLAVHVVANLKRERTVSFERAAAEIRHFIGKDRPEFWLYYGAYDW